MRLSRLIAAVALPPVCAGAQHPTAIEHHLRYGVRVAEQPDTSLEILDRMRSYHIPGLSIAVIDNFRVVFAKGYGVTQVGGNRPVDSTTLFLAGSISKPVFASGFLRLLDDRKISLDTNVNALLTSWHLPESRFTEHEKVTLRRLLTHTAGLTVWGFPGYALGGPVPTVPQLLDGLPPANSAAPKRPPDTNSSIHRCRAASTSILRWRPPGYGRRLPISRAGRSRWRARIAASRAECFRLPSLAQWSRSKHT